VEIESIPLKKTNTNQFYLLHKNRNFTFEFINANLEKNCIELKSSNKIFQVQINGPIQQLIQSLGYHEGKAKHTDALLAPMPGVVLDNLVAPDYTVIKGDPVNVFESMKKEKHHLGKPLIFFLSRSLDFFFC